MGKGKRFELAVKNNINEHTGPLVKAHRPDYSGNSKGEVADIMVVWEDRKRHVTYVELKKRSADYGNRATVMSGRDGDSGLGELQALCDETPPWTDSVVAVKFPHRALLTFDAQRLVERLVASKKDKPSVDDVESAHSPFSAVEPRLTPSDNISMVCPEDWPSQRSGPAPWRALCENIGVHD